MNKIIICPNCKTASNKLLSSVSDVEYFTTSDHYDYYECLLCHVIFLNNPPVQNLNLIYPDNYYAVIGPNEKTSSLMRILEVIKKRFDILSFSKSLKKISSSKLNCLDIGGGTGWVMNLVRESDSRVQATTILDINKKSELLANANGHKFICGPVESLDSNNEFDFVLLLNLIEHVQNPEIVLNTIFRSMKSGGLLYIKTPNTDSINRYIFDAKYWGGFHAPRHWVLFNKANFSELARKTGYSIEKFTYTQGAPQWAASILGTFFKGNRNSPMHTDFKFSFLLMLFACIDYLRLPFCKTDQMIFLLKKP
jgi:2-polyprenyl-3-methyl-5-hydroxy-6-metoxy-1,4-benzoquinol methylase